MCSTTREWAGGSGECAVGSGGWLYVPYNKSCIGFVANVHGIEFINDSKATNVNSVWYALESVTKPIVWIAGGVDKGNDYSLIESMVQSKVKAIICLGVDNKKIHEAFSRNVDLIINTSSMEEAVKAAYRFSTNGDCKIEVEEISGSDKLDFLLK